MSNAGLAWLPCDLFNWPGLHLYDQTSDRNNHSHIIDLMQKMVHRQFALQVIRQLDADLIPKIPKCNKGTEG